MPRESSQSRAQYRRVVQTDTRGHQDDTGDVQAERDMRHLFRSDRLTQRDRQELIEGAHDGRRQPAQCEQVRESDHRSGGIGTRNERGGDGPQTRGASDEEDLRRKEVLTGQTERRGVHRHTGSVSIR